MTTGKEHKTEKNEDSRSAYREKREAQIQEMAARLDLWEAKAKKARADARIRAVEEVGKLRGKLETARLKVSLLQDTGETAWEDLRKGVESAMEDLRSAFKRAASRFEAN
ncbi:MAG: coiled coil domain-containing protein [Gemmatimonadota bacterium]